MFKPKKIGHLVLNVKDVDAATKFYTDVLRFEVAVQRPDGSATFLTCGEAHHDLALFKAPEGAAPVNVNNLGLNHFAVQVEDEEALKDLYSNLKEHGMEPRTVDHGMTGSLYINDPDGNGIEFYFDKFESPADGLAEIRRPGRENTELVLG